MKNGKSGRPSLREGVDPGFMHSLYLRWFMREAPLRELTEEFERMVGRKVTTSTLHRWFTEFRRGVKK